MDNSKLTVDTAGSKKLTKQITLEDTDTKRVSDDSDSGKKPGIRIIDLKGNTIQDEPSP